MYAINKHTGAQVRGTYERLHGLAEISEYSFRRDADGTIEFDHEGGTEIYWDDEITVRQDGKIVYLDVHGAEITQDDIVLVDKLPASG